jgi:hypothetical protein
LAALVIQDLGRDVLTTMQSTHTRDDARVTQNRIEKKVHQYLRPPDPKDKWWERLIAADKGRIDARLDEAAQRTLTTENQCMASPLKNIEVSKNSLMLLPVGLAVTGRQFEEQLARLKIRVPDPGIRSLLFDHTTFQIGVGLMQKFPLEPVPDDTVMRALSTSLYELFPIGGGGPQAFVAGAQFTKRF